MADSIAVYRALQQHTGNMNIIVVKLYNGEITTDDALAQAEALNDQLTTDIEALKA